MKLVELKTRYETNCKKCNREIKRDWKVWYDKDTKDIYCMPCGKELTGKKTEKSSSDIPAEKLSVTAHYDDLILKLDRILAVVNKLDNLFGAFMALMSEPDSHQKAKEKISGSKSKKK